jgi:DNA-binding HxlR family transcriptional regulator
VHDRGVPEFRYAQFCPLARAAELLGERWTVLLVRELLLGPQRFSDLRRRLPGLSASVLAERLARLERRGIVARRRLPPPAASTVYELREAGRALLPVMVELGRWGVRFLLPATPGDHFEPDWLRVSLRVFAARAASPSRRVVLCAAAPAGEEVVLTVEGGPAGTRVRDGAGPDPADATLRAAPSVLLGLVSGLVDPRRALRAGELELEGDATVLADLPALFEIDLRRPQPDAASSEAGRPPTVQE